jgi:hypothetical protein
LAWQTYEWSAAVRSAVLVNVVRKIPVRSRALAEMRLDWWHATLAGRRVEAWHPHAAVQLYFPAAAMKANNRAYEAPYIRADQIGVADYEIGARRALVELYLQPFGAREFLLTVWTYAKGAAVSPWLEHTRRSVLASPYFFPGSAIYGNTGNGGSRQARQLHGLRWSSASLSVHFADLVRAHAEALQINLPALEPLFGALRIHVARLLFGHHNAPRNLGDTSRMLHHKDINTTWRLYVGRASSETTFERERSDPNRGVRSATDLLENKDREIAALRREVAALRVGIADAA